MNGFSYNLPTLNNLNDINADSIEADNITISYLNGISSQTISYISNVTSDIQQQLNNVFGSVWSNLITQPSTLSGSNNLIASIFSGNINANKNVILSDTSTLNLQKGYINQNSASSINQLARTNFINNITLNANLTQSSGSSTLLDSNIGVINQNDYKYITQSGNNGTNTLRQTYISDLIVTNSMVFPSTVTLPATTYNDDIVMNDGAIIQTDTTGLKQNQFINSDFINDVYFDGNINMTNTSKICNLKNTTITGELNINADVTQTTGSNTFNDTTIEGDLVINGTLETVTVSNEQFNTLSDISTASTIQQQINSIISDLNDNYNTIDASYNSLSTIVTNNFTILESEIVNNDTDILALQNKLSNVTNTSNTLSVDENLYVSGNFSTALITSNEFNTLSGMNTGSTIQSQLNNLQGQISNNNETHNGNYTILANDITTLQNKTVYISTTTGSTNITGALTFTTNINGISSPTFSNVQYLRDISYNINDKFNTIDNEITTLETNVTNNTNDISDISNNITGISYSYDLDASNNMIDETTTISNNLVFSGTINNISNSAFSNIQYLTDVSYNINDKIQKILGLSIGNVYTLSSSQDAYANIYFDDDGNWLIDFGIPQGEKGDTGSSGGGSSGGGGGLFGGVGKIFGGGGSSGIDLGDIINFGVTAAAFAALETQILALQSQIVTLQTQIASIQVQIAEMQLSLASLETQMAEAQTNISNLQYKTTAISYSQVADEFNTILSSSTNISNTLNCDENLNTNGNITIASGSSLICNQISSVSNSIEIGNLTSNVYINGFLYNPLSNSFFNSSGSVSQW